MITVIVGTETGTAEYVADEIIALLEQHHIEAEQTLTFEPEALLATNTWLICTSTHGAGEVPNNLTPFEKWLDDQDLDLSAIKFAVIALGDSSYDTFCQAGISLHTKLQQRNATALFPTITIDAMDDELPEDIAVLKLQSYLSLLQNN